MNKTVYLDHAAATPLRREVVNAMYPLLTGTYGNPSSLHRRGREARDVLENARAKVANLLGVSSGEIVFTGGGTEANNLALFGVAGAHKKRGKHVLISQVEHPSVLSAGEQLAAQGFSVEYVPVDHEGAVNVEDVLSRVEKETVLISVMYANNEIGTIQPVQKLARLLREKFDDQERPLFHTDACQAAGQLPIQPNVLGVDLLTINGSKIYGPKGVGVLYVREGTPLSPHTVGGHQEFGRRAGTENIPLIVGFATALEIALAREAEYRGRLTGLRNYCMHRIAEMLPEAVLNGSQENRLPNNIHISIPHIEGESLLLLLDSYGIAASTGSACSSHNLAPSHVLRAIGQSDELIHGSIRFTLGDENTEADIEYAVHTLTECADRLKQISPLPLSL